MTQKLLLKDAPFSQAQEICPLLLPPAAPPAALPAPSRCPSSQESLKENPGLDFEQLGLCNYLTIWAEITILKTKFCVKFNFITTFL